VPELDPLGLVAAKLDTLIRLQATSMVERLATQRERIAFLNKVGLGPKAIAEILGTTSNTVSVALAKMRKSGANDAE
jgi:DNA-binding CsgD family transcriptional regulator